MAYIISVCLTCKSRYDKAWDDYYKQDVESHGYCEKCGREYEKEVERQIEELKKKRK